MRALTHAFVGVQAIAGLAMVLFNDANGSTRCWLVYDSAAPVVIR